MVLKGPLVAAGLVAALLLGFGIARATDSVAGPPATAPASTAIPSHSHGGAVIGDLGGFSLSAAGFTLVPAQPLTVPAGARQQFAFKILGPDGGPVTRYVLNHDKPMHFIAIKHDLSGFQHLHPTMAADGTWTIRLSLPTPGIWRLYADFVTFDPAGQRLPLTLAVEATVAGSYTPLAVPPPSRTVDADTFTVTLEGTPQVNATQPLSLRVFASGAPVTDLERYLGAYGHLVVIRDGDLGYLHVHPEDQLVGGAVKFWLSAPSPGRYRLYFEFQKSDAVHRAEFTVDVP
ncbi:hypothetical protein ABT297_01230 [Dactylosporangium sp. NPDC000555]|uniref:hypothetical protein n=1 Tax=Dactylosporangium sp. NPDC000555 TaxID=3154260 RepID=UPI00332BD4DB